jgi:hypothetical protein
VAAMMTGGATRWCCVGMAAPLMLPPARYAFVGGSCTKQYYHFSSYSILEEVQDPMDPRRDVLCGQTDLAA